VFAAASFLFGMPGLASPQKCFVDFRRPSFPKIVRDFIHDPELFHTNQSLYESIKMARGSVLKNALNNHKGIKPKAEKQKKYVREAEKRKLKSEDKARAEAEANGVPLDEVEVKLKGKKKDSKKANKAAQNGVKPAETASAPATEAEPAAKEPEWETDDDDEDASDDDDDEPERPTVDLAHLEDSDSDISSDEEENQALEAEGKDEDAEDDEDDDDEDDIALSDLDSVASEDKGDIIPHQRLTINNTAALTAALHRIQLPYSKLAFSEHQSVTTDEPVDILDVEDDLNRELAFYKQCLSSVKDARKKLRKEGVSFSRPSDYFAEMVKSDEHMGKIKQKLVDAAAGKKAAAEARKQRDLKKFGKQVQTAKLQERSKEKRDTIEKINTLKRSTYLPSMSTRRAVY
jgi:rRNA-processing protein EBP2